MKVTMEELQALGKVLKPSGVSPTVAGEGDFLARVNHTIKNFRELMEVARSIPGLGNPQASREVMPGDRPNPGASAGPSPNPGLIFLSKILNSPMADMTVTNILGEIGPLTLKQVIQGLLTGGGNHARPK